MALNIATISKTLTLTTKTNINPNLIYQTIHNKLTNNTILNTKTPIIINHNFKPNFHINLHIKNLTNTLNTSHNINTQLPLTTTIIKIIQTLQTNNLKTTNHNTLTYYYKKLTKIKITH